MLTKDNIKNAKKFCCEDISKIENYDKAIADNEKWLCHHRLGIELNKSGEELQEIGLYYNRPASELIFLTRKEHRKIHNEFIRQETREKLSKINKKYWAIQENREKQSERAHKRWESQENREKQSKIQKDVWSSQELRDKQSIIQKQIYKSQEIRDKLSKSLKGKPKKKFKWLTPDGEIKIMDASNAKKNHPDWIMLQ